MVKVFVFRVLGWNTVGGVMLTIDGEVCGHFSD